MAETRKLRNILSAHSLDHYLDSFLDNEVDDSVLASLTKSDLADIGITAIGARRKLLEAFSQTKPPDRAAQSAPEYRGHGSASEFNSERKLVSVLFADIQGSTASVSNLDAETASQKIRTTVQAMIAAVHQFGGTVNKVMGDGVMALFGAPIALEDHAARACFAGISIRNALEKEAPFRVGIHSGEVIVDAIKRDFGQDYDAHGPTVHIAARMEQNAETNQILISNKTAELARGFIECRSLPNQHIKGFDAPIDAFAVIDRSGTRSRWQAGLQRVLTPLIGRAQELRQLKSAVSELTQGKAGIIVLNGDPGIGKSRLLHETSHYVVSRGIQTLETATKSYGAEVPFLPFQFFLEAWSGIHKELSNEKNSATLCNALATLDISSSLDLAAACELVGLSTNDPEWFTIPAPTRRIAIQTVILKIIDRLSKKGPLLLIIEDLHWIDFESEAILDRLVRALKAYSVLIIATTRPEYTADWLKNDAITVLHIEPLSDEAIAEHLNVSIGTHPSTAELKRLILDKTAGNPLYLEEVERSLIESGTLVGEPGNYCALSDNKDSGIPTTLDSVLSARIDLLPPGDKRILQLAAVIGRSVPFSILTHIAKEPDTAVYQALQRLTRQSFLHPHVSSEEPCYVFKHMLIQDVAYNQLLKRNRKEWHRDVANYIERHFHNRVEAFDADLARHAFAAEQWSVAANRYWQLSQKYWNANLINAQINAADFSLRAINNGERNAENYKNAAGICAWIGIVSFPIYQDVDRTWHWLNKAYEYAELSGDTSEKINILASKSQMAGAFGDSQMALQHGEAAFGLCQVDTNLESLCAAVGWYAAALLAKGNYRKVVNICSNTILPRRHEFGADAILNFGAHVLPITPIVETYLAKGESVKIDWMYHLIEQVNDRTINGTVKMASLGALALRDLVLGNYESAENYAAKGVDIALRYDLSIYLRDNLLNRLVLAKSALGDLSGATDIFEIFAKQKRTSPKTREIYCSQLFASSGALELARGNHERAEQEFRKSAVYYDKLGSKRGLSRLNALRLENACYSPSSTTSEFKAIFDDGWTLAAREGLKPYLGRLKFFEGLYARRHGNMDAFNSAVSQAFAYFNECNMPFWANRVMQEKENVQADRSL